MDYSQLISLTKEFLVPLVVFGVLLAFVLIRGRRALISLILGLYFAFLILLQFPYSTNLYTLAGKGTDGSPILKIGIFLVLTLLGMFLFRRLLNEDLMFYGIAKKVVLALLATILVITFCYHVLPVRSLIDPGATLNTLFAPPQYFFWLFILPLVGLFFL